jgi:hypothetical protein
MNEDTYFIGLDAVNSPNWKWMPGMLYVVNRPAPLEPVVGRVPDQVRGWAPYPGAGLPTRARSPSGRRSRSARPTHQYCQKKRWASRMGSAGTNSHSSRPRWAHRNISRLGICNRSCSPRRYIERLYGRRDVFVAQPIL